MKRISAALVAIGMLPPLLAGCGVTRDGAIAPSVNDCVAALPVAQTLLGNAARLTSLRRLSLAQTQGLLTRLGASRLTVGDATPGERASIAAERKSATAGPTRATAGPRPCVLAFVGSFTAAALRTAPGHPAATAVTGTVGDFALVVTTTRHPRVLRAVVTGVDPLT